MKRISTLILILLMMGVGRSWGQIVKFDLSTLTGGTNNFGPSPLTPTTSNSNVTIVGLTRGSGIGTTGSGAAKGWGGTGFTTANNTQALGLSGNQIVTFTITANAGYTVSLTGIPIYNIRRSGTGPSTGIWQYQVGAGAFTDIGTAITWGAVTSSAGNDQAPIDLSGISALQNVAAGTTITLRVILWGSTGTGGTWYFNDQTSGSRDLIVNGNVLSAAVPAFNISNSMTGFSTLVNTPSSQQSYTISGINLTPNQTNGISITAPADFEVSLTSNTFTGTNGNTVNLSSNGAGNIVGEPVPIYVRYFPSASGTTSASISHSGAGVSPAQTSSISGTATAYFYSKATGDLTSPSTYNSAADGSGTDAVNFTNNNQTFEIRNRSNETITSDWTVSGTSSKIVVGSGVTFTVPSSNFVSGKIDVLGTGKLILQNATMPTLGTMASGSTVEYAQSSAVNISNTTNDAVTYSNLTLSGSGVKTFKGSTTTITGNLIFDGNTNGALTFEASSASPFSTISLGGDMTYSGSVTSPADANSITLSTTGSGTQTITANGNTVRFFRITTITSGNSVVLSSSGGGSNALLGNTSGGGITLATGTTLVMNGNTITFFAGNNTITGAGTITGSPTSSIIINKTGATALGTINFTAGSRSLKDLTINNTATTNTLTLGTPLDIYGTLTVTAGQIVLGANNLTLKSGISGTARFAATTVAAPISYNSTGKVVVERYIANAGHRAWHLLSAPVSGTQTIYDAWQEGGNVAANLGTLITSNLYDGLNGYDMSSNSASILTHNQGGVSGPSWNYNLANTNSTVLSSNPGYMLFVRGDRNYTPTLPSPTATNETVLRSTGSLRVGDQSAVTVSATGTGRTLVGNPYASAIDIDPVLTGTANIDQNVYIWDPTATGNYGVGAFAVVERDGGGNYTITPFGGSATADANSRYMHSGQAFFLKATGSDASVVFTEAMKVASVSAVNPIVNTQNREAQLYTNLMIVNPGSTPSLADGIRVRFSDNYSAATADDILKMGNFAENISSFRDNKKLIVEKRPVVTANDTIFLRMSNTGIKDYQLQVGALNFAQQGVMAFVEDAYTGKRTALDMTGNVNKVDFSITADAASANPDRFRIVFAAAGAVPVTKAFAARQGNSVAVGWNVSNQHNMKEYTIERSADGTSFTQLATVAANTIENADASYSWLDRLPNTGDNYYRIVSTDNFNTARISNTVNVKMLSGNPAITVYPNPVTEHVVGLQFKNMEAGSYQVKLFNNAGQAVIVMQLSHTGGDAVQQLALPKTVTAGFYQLEITRPDNSKMMTNLLITK